MKEVFLFASGIFFGIVAMGIAIIALLKLADYVL